jgi:hypothetical protein
MQKTNPSFNSPSFFPCPTPFLLKQSPLRLSLPSIAMTTSDACGQPSPLPPSPSPHNKGTINNQSSLSLCQLKLLSAYAMLLPPTHRCCHRHHHAAAAFPNALLLPLKSRFRQAAASAAKLAATAVLPPPPPLLPRGHCCATTA